MVFLPDNILILGHGGFGFNTNIFETNIINLAVVIGVVVSFVGSNLTALLEDRKKTIVNNLQEATQRALEAEEKLNQARTQLELAKKKAKELFFNGKFEGQVRPLSSMIEHFWPIPGWSDQDLTQLKQQEYKICRQLIPYNRLQLLSISLNHF